MIIFVAIQAKTEGCENVAEEQNNFESFSPF